MTAAELIRAVEKVGGSLEVSGDRLRYRLPADTASKMIERLRQLKTEIIAALRQPQTPCDCPTLPDGEPVHRPDCPVVEALRRGGKAAVWLEAREPDPARDAVRALLKPGEYIDERGRIRRVQ